MAQNEIRGTSQIKNGTISSNKVQPTFFTDVMKSQYWTGDNSTTDFELTYEPQSNTEKVFLRGIRILDGYSIVDAAGTWYLRFASAPEQDDMVLIEYLKVI